MTFQDKLKKGFFDALYYGAMGGGGDGEALMKCRNTYKRDRYLEFADGFELYLIDTHNYQKIDIPSLHDHRNGQWDNPYNYIQKGKSPFIRGNHDKNIVFQFLPETAIIFRDGIENEQLDQYASVILEY